MSTTGGVNFVRYFFYRQTNISAMEQANLVALAYATATDLKMAPTAILIRSRLHDTTTMNGQHVKDPKGWHVTLSFKFSGQDQPDYHTTMHGYTDGKDQFVLREAVPSPEKPDNTKKASGKPVWNQRQLVEYTDSPIGHSHLGSTSK